MNNVTVKKRIANEMLNNDLFYDISEALNNINGWGSVELFVQNYKVVQITGRNIKKTQHNITNNT